MEQNNFIEKLSKTYSTLKQSQDRHYAELKVRHYIINPFISNWLNINPTEINYCQIENFHGIASKSRRQYPDYCCRYRESGTHFVIETKSWNEKNLDVHIEQLKSYIRTDIYKIKIGILTNGNEYRFYKRTIKPGDIELHLLCSFKLFDDDIYNKFYLNSIFEMSRCEMCDSSIKFAEYEFNAINYFKEHNIELTDEIYSEICSNRYKCKFEIKDYDELIDENDTIIQSTNQALPNDSQQYMFRIHNSADFSKFIEFDTKHKFSINDYIPNKKYHSLLLFGNLVGLCGKNDSSTKKLSSTEKSNIEFIKRNSNALFTVVGTIEIYNYFYELFLKLGISVSKIKFLNINNGSDFNQEIELLKDKNMKFDVAIVNPPYKRMLYVDVILSMLPFITEHYVGIHPLTYCMYSQSNEKHSQELKKIMRKYETHIFIKNPLDYFPYEAYIGQIFGITHINMTKKSALFLNDIKKKTFGEINSYADGNEMLMLIPELLKELYKKDNVTNHLFSTKNAKYKKLSDDEIGENELVIRIPRSSGGQTDYYSRTAKTLISVDDKENPITKYKDFDGEYFIRTGTKNLNIAERIKETLKTDFMRMTLFVTKPTNELVSSIANPNADVMRMMPWLDWKDKMFEGSYKEINERLFEKYIPDEIREKLKYVLSKELPNIYG